jgi:hypothetical protein
MARADAVRLELRPDELWIRRGDLDGRLGCSGRAHVFEQVGAAGWQRPSQVHMLRDAFALPSVGA